MWPGDTGTTGLSTSGPSTDPFNRDFAVQAMTPAWQTMYAVTSGTEYLRWNAPLYLPREPREDEDAYNARVNRSVLSPYTTRLIENAAGTVLRRPIRIQGDDYWEEFSENVDGLGSSINEYARRALVSSLTFGHSGILVDYPRDPGVLTLAEERALRRRPYFNNIDAPQIWGWRQENTLPSSDLTQLRIHEWVTIPEGDYGEERVEQIRVIYRNRYEVFRRSGPGSGIRTERVAGGRLPLGRIPFVPIYSNRLGMLTSAPLMLDIANLNLAHYQRQADIIHALHIAAMPILVLEGWEDVPDTSVGVNYAMAMTPGNKAYYVNADASSFAAQSNELQQLESQMSYLGITKLLGQKFVAESADAKRIDQAQANSVMSIIAMELESCLNQAYQLAAAYIGIEPPEITIDKDFDFYRLLGQDIAVLNDLRSAGAVTDETFLKILRQGEILPDTVDLNEELENLARKQAEQAAMAAMAAPAPAEPNAPAAAPSEPAGAAEPDLRAVMEERLRRLASRQNETEDED